MKVSAFPFFLYIDKILMSRVMCYFGERSSDKSFMYEIDLSVQINAEDLSHLELSKVKQFYKLEQYFSTNLKVLFQSSALKGTSILIYRFL